MEKCIKCGASLSGKGVKCTTCGAKQEADKATPLK